MIYCVIFDTKQRENNIRKKNDCRILRQSILPLPTNISEYVNEANNPISRSEREAAYSSLLSSLKCFYSIEDPLIIHQKGKKPIISSHNIFFNISHSDGITVVTLSDKYDVGVDIQYDPGEDIKKRLEKRFLSGFAPEISNVDIKYFLVEKNDEFFDYYEIMTHKTEVNFTTKWASMESCMKLYGEGFSALSNIQKITENSRTDFINIKVENTDYSIANSIKNG